MMNKKSRAWENTKSYRDNERCLGTIAKARPELKTIAILMLKAFKQSHRWRVLGRLKLIIGRMVKKDKILRRWSRNWI